MQQASKKQTRKPLILSTSIADEYGRLPKINPVAPIDRAG
jgi:hypothetical protein